MKCKGPSLLFLIFILQTLVAQDKILETRITVTYNQASLKEIINDLSTRYNIKFSYSESLLPINTKVTFSGLEQPLYITFETIFTGTNIGFKEIRHQIVLYPKPVNEEYTISGFVRDSANGEGIIGVVVYNGDNTTGTTTNYEGFYSLRLKEGPHSIRFSYMGYIPRSAEIEITENQTLNIELHESSTLLKEVTVTPDLKSERVLSTLNGVEKVDIRTLRKIPNLLGEPDIIRTLAFLPGITSNELSLGEFNIRGGATNQTLFQMDEAPIAQISHFGGIFSLYNPDIVKQVVISKGNFAASEKGALSAVIDVKLKEGNKKDWSMSGGVGTIFSRFVIEGPIKKDKTSIIIAGRKSYIDQLLKLFPNQVSEQPDIYQFNDFNVKIDHRFNWKNTLSLAAFYGSDIIMQDFGFTLGNTLGILKWGHFFNQNFQMESKLIAGNYSFFFDMNLEPEIYTLEMQQRNYQWHNNFIYYLNQRIKIKAGYQANWNETLPLRIESTSNESILKDFSLNKTKILEQSLFAESDLIIYDRFAVNIGIRCTYFLQLGPQRKYYYNDDIEGNYKVIDTLDYTKNQVVYKYFSPEPRISLRYLLSSSSSIKASYTRGVNFIHKLAISTITLPISRLMPSNSMFPPEKADNYSVGYYFNALNSKITTSLEAYFRKMSGMVENKQNSQLQTTDQPELFVRSAEGKAYGIELSANGNIKSIDFMLSYSFAHTRYLTEDVNNNKPYPPLFDITHAITAFVSMELGRRFEIGINWIFQSGLPYTEPAGIYSVDGRPVMQFDNSRINTKRLPPYHRMDLSISFTPLKNAHRRWKNSWNFSLYNVYARKNPLGVTYYLENSEWTPEMTATEQWKPRYVYFYQFIPSFSYNFKF
jgi:hypothetical protein